MKNATYILAALLVTLTSCGTGSRLASTDNGQRYQDGIYYTPKPIQKVEAQQNQAETEELIAKTKSSDIYTYSDNASTTVFVPNDKAAKVSFNNENTVITVNDPFATVNVYSWEAPFHLSDYWYYAPSYFRSAYSSYWWRSPWRHSLAWYYSDPWYYDPWGYSWGYYDP
jgi:hypothetical protein